MMILGVWYQISGFVEELQVKERKYIKTVFVFGKNSMKRIFIFKARPLHIKGNNPLFIVSF